MPNEASPGTKGSGRYSHTYYLVLSPDEDEFVLHSSHVVRVGLIGTRGDVIKGSTRVLRDLTRQLSFKFRPAVTFNYHSHSS